MGDGKGFHFSFCTSKDYLKFLIFYMDCFYLEKNIYILRELVGDFKFLYQSVIYNCCMIQLIKE